MFNRDELLLLLLLKKVSSARLGESDIHSPTIPTYRQKEEKGKESRRLWHTPHGIIPPATPKNNKNCYLLYEQPSLVKLLMSIHFLLLQMTFR